MEIEGREATAVDLALDRFRGAARDLVDVVEGGGFEPLSDKELVGFLQELERVRHRLALVDHRAVRDGEGRRLPEKLSQPSMARLLAWALRLSRGEAGRRVRAAEALGERVTTTGEALGPLRPALAAVQRDGLASPEQVDVCVRALAGVDHRGFDPADADRRQLAFRPTRDGMYAVEGRLTGSVGAKLQAVLGPLAKPRVETVTLDDGRKVDEPDPRHHGQRTHDALEEVCDRLLRSGTLPDSGGTPATVIVTIDEHDLQARRRWGVTSDGTMLSAEMVVDLADQAEIYPAVVDSSGVVLQLGRTRRLASCGQTMALIARDGGCSFPGCDRPPQWCERHHVLDWARGGRTDLDNLTLCARTTTTTSRLAAGRTS